MAVNFAKLPGIFTEAVIRSVVLIVQPEADDVVGYPAADRARSGAHKLRRTVWAATFLPRHYPSGEVFRVVARAMLSIMWIIESHQMHRSPSNTDQRYT